MLFSERSHRAQNRKKAALIYPGESAINEGKYYNTDNKSLSAKDCSVLTIPPNKSISDWQMQIANTIFSDWLKVDQVV